MNTLSEEQKKRAYEQIWQVLYDLVEKKEINRLQAKERLVSFLADELGREREAVIEECRKATAILIDEVAEAMRFVAIGGGKKAKAAMDILNPLVDIHFSKFVKKLRAFLISKAAENPPINNE